MSCVHITFYMTISSDKLVLAFKLKGRRIFPYSRHVVVVVVVFAYFVNILS